MRSSAAAVCLLLALSAPGLSQDIVIQRWLVHVPLPAPEGPERVVRDHIGGEAAALPTLGDEGWIEFSGDTTGRVNLNIAFADRTTEWSAAYAHTYVFAPEDRTVLLIADSDDDLLVRVNGQRVWVNQVARGLGWGRDTVMVRLAEGWNSLLLKPLNRGGGFGLLAKLAPAPGSPGLIDLELSIARPPGLIAHNYPAPAVTVGPVRWRAALSWEAGELTPGAVTPLIAWGPDTLRQVSVQLQQGDRAWPRASFAALPPGQPIDVEIELPFRELRRASLGATPIVATTAWRGGSLRRGVAVDPELLMRLIGGRIEIGSLQVDSAGDDTVRLYADLVVPPALDGLSIDLLTRGLGPRAAYRVNGRASEWRDGVVELCAPCRGDDKLHIEIEPEPGRPLWLSPVARIRELGYSEYADGYDYAIALTSRAPSIQRPDARDWLQALGEPTAYRDLMGRYATAYAPLSAEIKSDTLHLIGNSHIDAAWLWPWSETIDVIRDTWRTSLKLAEIFPGYIFTGSSAAYYNAMDLLESTLADSLIAAVEAGYWMPVGGWWVESDLNVPSGESLVRQGLYGQRYFEQRFGFRSRVAWTPDCFGYPWTIPQILRGAGLEYFVTQKIRWNDSTELPYNAFYWEGLDGSRVLTYNPYGYTHNLEADALVRQRIEDRERTNSNHQIVLYGVGDHGGGPTIEMLERAENLRRVPTFPVMKYDEPLNALLAVQGHGATRAELPVWRDELYLEYHRGTYTSQADAKRRNRRSEEMLHTVEALLTVGQAPYPRERLQEAWRLVLFNQFHDILPGSGIREIYEDADLFYDRAWALIDSLASASFSELRARMDTRGGDDAIVVFNPLGWARDGVAVVEVPGAGGQPARVAVTDVPAYGAKVVRPARDPVAGEMRRYQDPAAGPDWIENAFLRVEVDTLSGEIVRIYDKQNRREVLAPAGRGNVLQVLDDRPNAWDAWNIVTWGDMWEADEVQRTAGSSDAWEARYEVERRWGNSVFRQTLVLGRAAPYLEVLNDFDWHERRKALKVAFTLGVEADSATYEIPYGTMKRSGRPRTQAERAKFEVPGQRWADVSQADYGVSILNDSKYGWDYKENVLRLTLLKAPIWPDSLADRGRHRFRFAIYPHAGDWRAAGTVRMAAEYNTALLAAFEPPHDGPLGKSLSFAAARSANVQITSLKRAEDSDAWVLRLVEWHGVKAEVDVEVGCDVAFAHRSNLLEDSGGPLHLRGNTISIEVHPYEIATVVAECRP
ncbi:MAG TPA: glycoside hydrolase family 38 C-terminal domain-containing protein [Gemmatimonadota bacterium]|nr:glycoside hydrolase family 38 C-terminal domain-containing protein [Gemmatimonadota bacterium]